MIAAVDRKLAKLHKNNKDGKEISFEDYVATMMQNPLIEKDFDGEIFRDQYKQFSRFGFIKQGISQQVVSVCVCFVCVYVFVSVYVIVCVCVYVYVFVCVRVLVSL